MLSDFSAKESRLILRIDDVEEYNSGIVLISEEAEASVDVLDDESGTIVSTIIAPKVVPVAPLVKAVN